jgi:type II secretory pathway pseudopilin PulG
MTARDRTVLIVVGVLAAVVAAWLLVVSPVRSHASQLGSQISTEQSQLDSARQQIAAGQAARSSFAANYTTMAKLGEAVPADDDVGALIVQVQAAATATRIDFGGLTLTPGSGSASPPPASASAGQSATASLPPGATVGPAGFPIEPFTFTFSGSFFHLSDFFGRLERFVRATNQRISVSGRLMTLNAISLGAGAHGFPQITATVSATTYILPSTQGLQAGATAAGPAAAQAVASGPSSPPLAPAAIGATR